MKVLDLRCRAGHAFEGWFGSEADYQSQHERGLLTCPVCGLADVHRLPSAPRLNLGSSAEPQVHTKPDTPHAPGSNAAGAEQVLLAAVRHVLAHTEDVGERFAEEARRMHYGEAPAHGIRGQTTPQERQALADEGIDVLTLPLPPGADTPVQ